MKKVWGCKTPFFFDSAIRTHKIKMKQQKTNNWQIKKLGEVCKIIMGQSPPSDTYNENAKGMPFFQGKAEFTDLYPVVKKYCSKPTKIAEPLDILLSVRAPVGTTNIANIQCCIGRGLAAIRFDNYKYGFYFLRSIQHELDSKGTGTTFRAISGETIRETLIPYPNQETQHAIVSKIEELFSELDKGIAELKTAQLQLKTYRQSVLKSAFEGKLTNDNVKEGELPDGWKSKSLKGLVLKVEKVKRKEVDENEELIYLDIGGINNDSNRIENYKKFFWKDAPSRAQQIVKQNDILFSTVRTYMKNIAIVDKEIYNNQIASSGFTVLRADTSVDYKYIYYNTISDVFLNPLNELQTGTSYPAVRDSDVLSQTINLPSSSEEQHLIVQEIESRLSVADKMEQSIQESLQKAEALRQSILKKAFCGELV